jgi:hypothetical protein
MALITNGTRFPTTDKKPESFPKTTVQPLKKESPKVEPAVIASSTTSQESTTTEIKPTVKSGTTSLEETTTATLGKKMKKTAKK